MLVRLQGLNRDQDGFWISPLPYSEGHFPGWTEADVWPLEGSEPMDHNERIGLVSSPVVKDLRRLHGSLEKRHGCLLSRGCTDAILTDLKSLPLLAAKDFFDVVHPQRRPAFFFSEGLKEFLHSNKAL